LFSEKKNIRKINIEEVKKYNIPISFYDRLHQGEDFIENSGTIINNELLTSPNAPPKTYAYCADTIYDEELIEKIKNVDLVYHEATYLHELKEKATSRFHCTSIDAATIAKKADVKKLLIGHFSSKYETLEKFEEEARSVFLNTQIALEGCSYII
jgi:ribonuclease Z